MKIDEKLVKVTIKQGKIDSILTGLTSCLVKSDRVAIQSFIDELYKELSLEPVDYAQDRRASNGGRQPMGFYARWSIEGKEKKGSLQEIAEWSNRTAQTLYRLRRNAVMKEHNFFWTTDGLTKDIIIITPYDNDEELEGCKQRILDHIKEQREGEFPGSY